MTTPTRVEAMLALLASPRFANALAVTTAGTAVGAEALERLLGWAGLIAIVSGLTALSGAVLWLRRKTIDWQGPLPVSLLIFLGWAAVSIVWSQYQWASAAGIAWLFAFAVLGATIALLRDTIQIVRAFGDVFRVILAVSIGLEVLSGVLIDVPIPFLGVEGNLAFLGPVQGIMVSRNQLGTVALLALVTFATEYHTRSVSRGLGIGSLVLGSAMLLLSRSPAALGALVVVGIAALLLFLLRRISPERARFWQFATLGAAALAAVVAWGLRASIVTALSATGELSYRLALWRRVWGFLAQHPLEGWGWLGQWRPDMQPFVAFFFPGEREANSALNAYLDVWFQLGLVGIFIFVVLVGLAFTRSWLLAGRRTTVVYAWPALILLALILISLAESTLLINYGWLLFVVCSVKAAQGLSWRRAFSASAL